MPPCSVFLELQSLHASHVCLPSGGQHPIMGDDRDGTPRSSSADWPTLSLSKWDDTPATLHLWTQILGKVRLAQAPLINQWWQVPLYVTARGLTTSPMHYGGR